MNLTTVLTWLHPSATFCPSLQSSGMVKFAREIPTSSFINKHNIHFFRNTVEKGDFMKFCHSPPPPYLSTVAQHYLYLYCTRKCDLEKYGLVNFQLGLGLLLLCFTYFFVSLLSSVVKGNLLWNGRWNAVDMNSLEISESPEIPGN